MEKLNKYFLKEAIRDIKFAKSKLKDKNWMENSSIMSKEMVLENSTKNPKIFAREKADYLKMRANAKGNIWGMKTYIESTGKGII
jgi:hypothetical protein